MCEVSLNTYSYLKSVTVTTAGVLQLQYEATWSISNKAYEQRNNR